MARGDRTSAGFFAATSLWLFGMLGLGLAYHFLTGTPLRSPGLLWQALELVSGWMGLLLPFAAFAGGLRVCRTSGPPSVLVRAGALAALCYGLLAYVLPVARYWAESPSGSAVEARAPSGAETPEGLKARRAYVVEHPPDHYGFSTDDPLVRPPNWLTYLLHLPGLLAVFSLLSAHLGWTVGLLTGSLPPAPRANARLWVGVGSAVGFMALVAGAGSWVREDPANSGLLAAWGPLLLPGAELAVLSALVRYRLGPWRALIRRHRT